MKKIFLLPAFAALAMTAMAQDFDTNPVVKIENQEEELQFTVGARMMADVAYYHSDFTPLKSGAALSDARIRTSMTYKDWYFYADFDFSKVSRNVDSLTTSSKPYSLFPYTRITGLPIRIRISCNLFS